MVRRIGSIVGGGNLAKAPSSPKNQSNEQVSFGGRSNTVPRKSRSLPIRMPSPFQKPSWTNQSKEKTVAKRNLTPPAASSTSEIAKVLISAKPSEIRAAVKASRAASKTEREQQQRRLQSHQEAQMKMNKIRAEIDAIKAMESSRNLGIAEKNTEELQESTEFKSATPNDMQTKDDNTAFPDLDSNIDNILASMEDDETNDAQLKDMGQKVLEEMEASFVQLGVASDDLSRSSHHNKPMQQQENQTIPPPMIRQSSNAGRHQRRPSNVVPEMRRRANNHDLFFDDSHIHVPSSTMKPMSTHSPVTGSGVTNNAIKSGSSGDKGGLTANGVHVVNPVSSHKNSEPMSQFKSPSRQISEPKSPTMIRCSIATSHGSPKRHASALARLEEEKQKADEQRKKLEEAKNYFKEGHDLCWKMQDSASALGGYRKALFIRESLLGKYHDETGRAYYWIGRSLVKLKDYDEALVAFSRAYRIFDRVLTKSHKYNTWAKTAIEGVFKEMDDCGRFCESYQKSLDDSIAFERAGDTHRKQGKLDEAISEYRAAIINIEEYHPDCADLHCKIAMILRRQGEFDKALEENRSALEIYELSLGAEHPETVKTLTQTLEKKRLNQVSLALMEKLDFGK